MWKGPEEIICEILNAMAKYNKLKANVAMKEKANVATKQKENALLTLVDISI